MKEIKLTQGKVALVDDEDFEWLNQWKWYAQKDRNTFYAGRNGKTRNDGKQPCVKMHRAILNVPENMQTDHRDGNGLHNWRNNLRICTLQQNQRNRRPRLSCSSTYKGITWDKRGRKWHTRIQLNKKRKFLGYFTSEIKAAKAYDKAALKYFGEFARLNFP